MLRSLKDIEGYVVSASDGEIGKVADFLLDDERWVIRYWVVETGGNFFQDRRQVETAVNREYETRLYDYYDRPADWSPGGFAESARPELR